jgi:ABC-type lipoprotein export system ATPase subunit
VLAAEALRFSWPGVKTPCIDIEAFRIAAGESVFLHGPSGCGKSTLLSLLAGVLVADEGRVTCWATTGPSSRVPRATAAAWRTWATSSSSSTCCLT